jgi:hypothetical protein
MENPADDPRGFAHADDGDLDVHAGLDALLSMALFQSCRVFRDFRSASLQGMSERTNRTGARQRQEGDGVSSKRCLIPQAT